MIPVVRFPSAFGDEKFQIQGGLGEFSSRTRRRRHISHPVGEQIARVIPSLRRPKPQVTRCVIVLTSQPRVVPRRALESDLEKVHHFLPFSVSFAHRAHPTPNRRRYRSTAGHPTSRHSIVAPQAYLHSTLRQRGFRRQPMIHARRPARRYNVRKLESEFVSTR
jgi:hypothetical protein